MPAAPLPSNGGRRTRTTVWVAVGVVVALFAAGALALLASSDSGPRVSFEPGRDRSEGKGYAKDLAVLLDDIEAYWADTYPELFGDPLQPLEGGVIAARPGTSLPSCGGGRSGYEDVEGNAFYCSLTDYIAYDDAALFPELDERYGVVALATVLAHEWGHAVQFRADYDASPVMFELQADCYAGAWLAHADRTFPSLGDDEKVNAMIAMLSFSDPIGTLSEDEGAHGSAFDRVSAFVDGLRNEAATCAAYDDDRPTFQLPFTSEEELQSGGNLPFDELIGALTDALAVPMEPESSACPVDDGDYVTWCGSRQRLAYSSEAEEIATGIGDFSVGFLALRALAVSDDSDDPYCQAGAQIRLLLEGADGPELSLSPGDLDEAVITLIFTSDASFSTIVEQIDRLAAGVSNGAC